MLKSVFFLLFPMTLFAEWSQPVAITEQWGNPSFAVNSKGHAALVYVLDEGGTWSVMGTRMLPSGDWSPPQSLTEKISPSSDYPIYPTVCMDKQGDSVAVWNCTHNSIQSSTLGAEDTQWNPILTVSPRSSSAYTGPTMGMDEQGNALVIWPTGFYSLVYSSYLKKGDSDWIELPSFEDKSGLSSLTLSVGLNGNALALWTECIDGPPCFDDGGMYIKDNGFSSETKQWTGGGDLFSYENEEEFSHPQVVSDSQGNVFTWALCETDWDAPWFVIKRFLAETGWQDTSFKNLPDRNYAGSNMTVDPNGNAMLIWCNYSTLYISTLSRDSTVWTDPRIFSTDSVYYWSCSIDQDGNRLVAWINENELKFSTLPIDAQGRWTDPVAITHADGILGVQSCSDGAIALIWNGSTLQSVTGSRLFKH